MATNPNGRLFISYRRCDNRVDEVDVLARMLRIRGVPTWVDRTNLRLRQTSEELERTIWSQETAGAILYMTPEIESGPNGKASDFIRELEAPHILRRARDDPGFIVIAVAAGGLTYGDADRIYGARNTLANLGARNMLRVDGNFLLSDAAAIARRALSERLQVIGDSGGPAHLLMTLDTRGRSAFRPNVALALDWTEFFEGRHCPAAAWADTLIPALRDAHEAIALNLPGRDVLASGQLSLPAALLLGAVFSRTSAVSLSWLQRTDGAEAVWRLSDTPAQSIDTRISRRDLSGADIILMVSATQSVDSDVARLVGSASLKARAIVEVDSRALGVLDSVTAAAVATAVRAGLIQARDSFDARGTIHAFLTTPAGLAVMIGQVLNTFLPLQTYEHDRGAEPAFRAAFLLTEDQVS